LWSKFVHQKIFSNMKTNANRSKNRIRDTQSQCYPSPRSCSNIY
jgi:hypothetical protein